MALTQQHDDGWSRLLCNVLDDMRKRKAFCDTIILADDGHVFTAHACILAAASPVLKTRLKSRDIHIQIDGISRRTWEILLQFMYRGDITVLDAAEIEEVLKAGLTLCLTGLAELCENLFLADASRIGERTPSWQEEINIDYDIHPGQSGGSNRVDEKSHDVRFPLETTCEAIEQNSFTGMAESTATETFTANGVDGRRQGSSAFNEVQCKQEPIDVQHTTERNSTADIFHDPNLSSQIFHCYICGKAFESADLLTNHVCLHRTHEVQHMCQICGKIMQCARALVVHMRTHTHERPFKCPVCGRAFSDLSNLGRHKRVHTGEKPYSCRVCGKSFSQVSHMKTHMRTHSGEHPYMCPRCGRTFKRKAAANDCMCTVWPAAAFSNQTVNFYEQDILKTVPMSPSLAT